MNINRIDMTNLRETVAEATYGKGSGAIEIGSGSKTNRLQFSESYMDQNEKVQSVVAPVYVEMIPKTRYGRIKEFFLSMMDRKFVKYENNGTTIYVNVNSLAKRLGINPADIWRASKKEDLNKIIDDAFIKFAKNEEKIDAMIHDYIKKVPDKNVDEKEILSIRHLFGIAINGLESQQKKLHFYKPKGSEDLLLVKKQVNGLPLVFLFKKKLLSDDVGGGQRQVVKELSNGGREVVARMVHEPEDIVRARNAYEIAKKISPNPKGNYMGTQPIFEELDFGNHYYGYTTQKYDGNLDTVKDLTADEKKRCARQLLTGLARWEELGIYHGNISEKTCSVKRRGKAIDCEISGLDEARMAMVPDNWNGFQIAKKDCVEFEQLTDELIAQRSFDEGRAYQPPEGFWPCRGDAQKEYKNGLRESMKQILLRGDRHAMSFVVEKLLKSSDLNGEQSQAMSALVKGMRNGSMKASDASAEFKKGFSELFPAPRSARTVAAAAASAEPVAAASAAPAVVDFYDEAQ